MSSITFYLEIDDDDQDVLISASMVSDDGTMSGDLRIDLPPGHTYRGIPYEVFKASAPGEFTLDELQQRAREKKAKERVA